jgi:uncharacterized protein (DUF885 family)
MALRGSLLLLSCVALVLIGRATEPPQWVVQSNANAQPVLEYLARYTPEYGTRIGLEQFDLGVIDLKSGYRERYEAEGRTLLQAIKAHEASETDPKLREDYAVMVTAVTNEVESTRLERELMLPFYNLPETVFTGLKMLLDPRNSTERQAKAIIRLKRYAGLETGYEPISDLAKQRSAEKFDQKNLIGPYVTEVQESLDNTDVFLGGISHLFKTAKLTGWEDAYQTLAKQLYDYQTWVKERILPRARQSNVLPEAVYAQKLKTEGVDLDPHTLIERARFEFIEIRDEMQSLAQTIAHSEDLPSSDYRDVIRKLKKKQVLGNDVLPLYKSRLAELEKLILEHNIVSLPKRPASIRLASTAESAAMPAPRMARPRLINNTGEYGEFVLPLTNPNSKTRVAMDDFVNEAVSWTLTVHEARPGHDLQFASMIENGVSLARAVLAENSANIEGWAVYMEAVMKPYEPLDGQMFALSHRMVRSARAFLDPMVNLGLMKPAEAKTFLMQEVVLSEPLADSEIDRYTFRSPGQAAAYLYGYARLREIRMSTELALRDKFNEKAFHDFILSEGLLPPNILEKAVQDEFIPETLGVTR